MKAIGYLNPSAPHERKDRRTEGLTLEQQILDYLKSKQVFHYRQPSGVSAGLGGHRIGPAGAPNIICVMNGQYIGIKLTRPGVKESENQKAFREELEAAGGKYVRAASLGDVTKALGGSSMSSHSER
jgi:hypothetical protein